MLQPVKQLGSQLQQAFAGLNKNNELVQGFQSLSKMLDAIADSAGIKLRDAFLHAIVELDVSMREWVAKQWWLNLPGTPSPLTPEEQQMTHAGRVASEEAENTPTKQDRAQNREDWNQALEGVRTHFPAAMQQGIEAFQTPPDVDRANKEWDQAVKEGRPGYYVKPEMAARDFERETGQKKPDWMSSQTAERIAQLLEQQNSLLRSVMAANGGGS
jgi:hypothetical protein